MEATGVPVTFTVAVCADVHPFAPVVVYVTVAEPIPFPTPAPVVAFTFNTEVFELDQTPLDTGFVNEMELPTHKDEGPAIGAFAGAANTFTAIGADVAEHPFAPVTVTE